MRLHQTLIFILAVSVLFYASCTDPALVGADLLDEDIAEVGFTDTFSLQTNTVKSDPVLTFSPFSEDQLDTYLFGTMVDPIFGRSSSAINAQFYPYQFGASTNPALFDDYIAVDSVVLILPYSTGGFYGDIMGKTIGMKVEPIDEVFNVDEDYFSDQMVATKADPLTEYEFEVNMDTLDFNDYRSDTDFDIDTNEVAYYHLRVPLPTSFGDTLLQAYLSDTTLYENRLEFLQRFPGIRLSPTVSEDGLVQFFLPTSGTSPALTAGLHVYYRDSADQVRRYLFNFNPNQNTRFTTFEHDYTGTVAEDFLDNMTENDSLVFLQGMAGLEGQITLPDFADLQNVIVNKAELEFYVADLESGDTTFSLPEQLVLVSEDDDGDQELLVDVVNANVVQQDVPFYFGGVPEEDETTGVTKYTLNISTYLQDVLDGTGSRVISLYPISTTDITAQKRAETAERVVLYGSGHPEFAPVLRLTFTRL